MYRVPIRVLNLFIFETFAFNSPKRVYKSSVVNSSLLELALSKHIAIRYIQTTPYLTK